MEALWLLVFFFLSGSVIYMIRAYRKSMRQNKLILLQSKEIQKQNRELEHRNKLLQELNVEKQQIIGIVSHDLKGPFNRIYALMHLMSLSSENLTVEQKEYLGKTHQIVADGLSMVRNLLDNRRLEDGTGIDMRPELLNIGYILGNLVKQYQSLGSKKNITLHHQGPVSLTVLVDRLYISRIFENLLSNAVKFSPSDKSIFVALKEFETEIEFSKGDESATPLLEVARSGPSSKAGRCRLRGSPTSWDRCANRSRRRTARGSCIEISSPKISWLSPGHPPRSW